MENAVLSYLGHLGLAGLLLGVVLEGLGVPFPGSIMVILAGVLVHQGKLNFYNTWGVIFVGLNLGAASAYLLGKYAGEPFLVRYGRYLLVTPARLQRARSWMEQSAPAFIIFGRFVPMVSNLTPYIAGLCRLSAIRFVFFTSIYALIWVSLNLAIGMIFSENWTRVTKITGWSLPALGLAGLLIYLGTTLARRWLRRNQKTV
ncbi:MAG: DedA family protein [Bacillota bacterium]